MTSWQDEISKLFILLPWQFFGARVSRLRNRCGEVCACLSRACAGRSPAVRVLGWSSWNPCLTST